METGESGKVAIKAGDYNLEKFCMEPTSFTVKEESGFKACESEFAKTKLMTRLTYTLDGMTGSFKAGPSSALRSVPRYHRHSTGRSLSWPRPRTAHRSLIPPVINPPRLSAGPR